MARTLKRQRVRQLRDAAKHAAHAMSLMSTPEDISEELWAKLEESLLGLLDFHMDYDATDLEHFCPKNVRLIVRLDLIRAGPSKKVERVMQRVIDALGMLCVLLEANGGDSVMGARIVLSQMMVSPWHALEDEDVIHGVAASIREHCLHVVFAWQGRKFQPYAADAIGAFLHTPRLHYERCLGGSIMEKRPRLVRVGIQFADCQLTTQDIDIMLKALTIKELTAASVFKDVPLSGVYTLESLTFKSVPLGEAELDALAIGLASPHTRCVDGLSLEKTLVLGNSAKYMPAFQRVLEAALQSKHSDVFTGCPGLKIAVAHNDLIQPVHVEALQEALKLATRPLSALSVASIPGGDIGTWLRLGQIMFTPSRVPVDGICELDISHITKEEEAIETLSRSLGTLVAETIPRVSSALLASDRVYCRVSGDDFDELSPHEIYEVVSVRASGESFSGWMQIRNPTAEEESSTWVSSSSITYLRIGEEDVVCCRFDSLVARGDWYSGTFVSVLRLLGWIGHDLRHLNLGDRQCVARALPAVMNTCPNLEELDLQYSNLANEDRTVWNDMPLHSLKAISLRHCYLTADSVTDLLTRILAAPYTSLRYLDLRSNNGFDSNTLDVLLKLVQKNRALVFVEIPDMCLSSDTPEETALRKQLETIDQYLEGEYLSAEIKLALLSVAGCRGDLRWDEYIVRHILAFTGSHQKRLVRWNKREPEAEDFL